MNVLIITDGITPFVVGGMQKHSANLVREFVRLGHRITLLHCVPFGVSLPNRQAVLQELQLPEDASLNTICIAFPKAGIFPGHYLKESYLFSQRCYNVVKDQLSDFDFIYAKGFTAWYFLQFKAKGVAMPPIGVKFHGYEMFQPPVTFRMRLQNWLLQPPVKWLNRQADYVFSYGGKITSLIEQIGVNRQHIIEIPTGIDSTWLVDKPSKRSSGAPLRFLFVGRYERRKGIEELHAVLPEVLERSEAEFQFLGPIPHSKRLRHNRVIYHGQLTNADEIRAVMDHNDILLVPSHSEGMPNVIMEGMARGMAILATDVGAVSAVVDHTNGLVLERCTASTLSEAILSMTTLSQDALQALQKRSIQKIGDFTWEKIAHKTLDQIESVTANPA